MLVQDNIQAVLICILPQMKQLLEKMEVVSRDLTEKRSAVTFTPKDLEEVTKWESELPESALTKYFNTWLKIHRTVQAANQSAEMEAEEREDEEEDIGSDDSEVEDPEPAPSPKKKSKKSKKLKIKEISNENGTQNVNDASPETSLVDQKKKKKKKKSKEKKVTVDEDAQSTVFVDNGDIVEDIVLSD